MWILIFGDCRRYFGHKPTIRPNNKKLSSLFLNRENMTWDKFASEVRKHQIGFMGEPQEMRLGKGEFHENPSACICEDFTAKAVAELNPRKFGRGKSSMRADVSATVDDETNDNEPELLDQEEEYEMNGSQDNSQFNGIRTDYNASTFVERELEGLISD